MTLRARSDGDRVDIDVSDEGPGFPSDFVHRAFDRFARSDQARSRAGAGLGLAIVRAIAQTHGGRAEVVATGDGGATVRVSFPAAP